jgi:hypothetical protein
VKRTRALLSRLLCIAELSRLLQQTTGAILGVMEGHLSASAWWAQSLATGLCSVFVPAGHAATTHTQEGRIMPHTKEVCAPLSAGVYYIPAGAEHIPASTTIVIRLQLKAQEFDLRSNIFISDGCRGTVQG